MMQRRNVAEDARSHMTPPRTPKFFSIVQSISAGEPPRHKTPPPFPEMTQSRTSGDSPASTMMPPLAPSTTLTPERDEPVCRPLTVPSIDVFSAPANLAGLPGISVPCGFTPSGLPVGLQFLGPPLGEASVLRASAALDRLTDAFRKEPAL